MLALSMSCHADGSEIAVDYQMHGSPWDVLFGCQKSWLNFFFLFINKYGQSEKRQYEHKINSLFRYRVPIEEIASQQH